MHLDLPGQGIISDRYFARVQPSLGVSIWAPLFQSGYETYNMAFFAAANPPTSNIYDEYLRFISVISNAGSKLYPTYSRVHDLLTIKCLIEETVEYWRKHRCTISRF